MNAKWITIVILYMGICYAMEEATIQMPQSMSSADLISESNIQRALSNYFKTHDADLCTHIKEPLKRKIEESSGEQLENTMNKVRDSTDLESLTQSLIADILKDALKFKNQSDSDSSAEEILKEKNKAKYYLYIAGAGLLTTITGVITTYLLKQ